MSGEAGSAGEARGRRAPGQPRGPILPVPALPKGGGAIRGIGEKLTAHPGTGTGAMTIPIATSPGRSGFGPDLALGYDSGHGNGPFGLGWTLSVPSIARKTDTGLPTYDDHGESDVFVLAGAEDLVPCLDEAGRRIAHRRVVHGVAYDVRPYRPRVEGLYARIERWTETATGVSHFRTITHDNLTSVYGVDDASRVASPGDPTRTFQFLIARSADDRGNVIVYDYAAEDDAGIDRGAAHEAHRMTDQRAVQRYLKRIRYGNTTPYRPDWSATGAPPPLPEAWRFEVVLDYGDHADGEPGTAPDRPWTARPDPFSTHRAGFEVRTYRRCRRVLQFHHFPEEAAVGADCLVRGVDLGYELPRPGQPIYSYLTSVTERGYRRTERGTVVRARPPLELEYSPCVLSDEVGALDGDGAHGLAAGTDGDAVRWVDLDGEGLTGALSALPGGWMYRRSAGPDGPRPRFERPDLVASLPASIALGRDGELLDLGGDGRLDLASWRAAHPGSFARDGTGWAGFRPFASLPAVDWDDDALAFVDLTGDGLADLLRTDPGGFTFWPSAGRDGLGAAVTAATEWDERRGPAIVLADRTETIFLADMTGDGLTDIVRVRNGGVCYWPNLGHARFGAQVVMDGAPRLDHDDRFDPRRIRLVDIDGSGTSDLLYIGPDGVDVYFNQSGNAWGPGRRLAVFPGADELDSVEVIDLRGTGTGCLV